ncbi:VC0807 family protein [Nonomuraea guangzhouensis]|uniref:VC0807 family protein n=1 Tax=Nonomuraea guangzhouensis TaxID=1291555 RepID=A0ABW4GPY1_9ACTN|nr:VC0807 family protein [Nonomuraea guangzhouensis]
MSGPHRGLVTVAALEFAGPLVIFYGLRAAGVSQWIALLAAGTLSAARAVHGLVVERRVSGITMFVLGAMVITIAMSFVSGSPRVLLIRNAWGTCALGLWALITLCGRRPFLYEAMRVISDRDKQQQWAANWTDHPAFRHLLRIMTAVWGAALLTDAALRVVMAATLPIDAVPLLDDVLLIVTLAALLAFQRLYGRGYLRRHGLRLRGVELSRIPEEPSGTPEERR